MGGYVSYLAGCVASGRMNRRMFMGYAMAAGLTAGTAGQLYATSAQAQAPKRGGHLKLGLEGGATTDTLDPAKGTNVVTCIIVNSFGDTLVANDPATGRAVPSLAESWQPSDGAAVWRFKIRKGIQFHNGQDLTAQDVARTLQRHMDPTQKSAAFGLLTSIRGIEVEGDDLVVTLSEGNVDLPLLFTSDRLIIQPDGGYGNPNAAIGTGPYKLVSWEPGVRATLERNPNDWRSDRGHVDSAEIIVINDATARIAALSSGQVHFINRITPKTVPLLKRVPNIEVLRESARGHYLFPMHCDTAPFDNNDLRLALKYAIDREAILEKALGGYGHVGNDFPINSTYAYFPEGIEQRHYDPDKAAFHLRKSGFDGTILLRTSEVAFPGAVDASVIFQESAKKAGISIEIKREPSDGYWANVWNAQPFCAAFWKGRATQDQMYSTAYLSDAAWNDTRFRNPRFDALLLQARSELDETRRMALYRDMSMLVRDEGGAIIPVFNDFINAAGPQLKGYVRDISGDLSRCLMVSRVWLDA